MRWTLVYGINEMKITSQICNKKQSIVKAISNKNEVANKAVQRRQ